MTIVVKPIGDGWVLVNTATGSIQAPDPNEENDSDTVRTVSERPDLVGDVPVPNKGSTIESGQNPSDVTGKDSPHDAGLGVDPYDVEICPIDGACDSQDGGDPVYLHSGEAFLYETDLSIPGRGFDWLFSRKYRSQVSFAGPLGYNWDFNYNRRLLLVTPDNLYRLSGAAGLSEPEPGDVLRMDGFGRVDAYEVAADGSYTGPSGYYTRLTPMQDGGFAERDFRGMEAVYAPPDADNVAKLASLQDRNGNTMGFSYDAAGRLVQVIDTLGRPIDYTYDGSGRLINVIDFTGRSLRFSYDANGDLVEVTSPNVTGTPMETTSPTAKRCGTPTHRASRTTVSTTTWFR